MKLLDISVHKCLKNIKLVASVLTGIVILALLIPFPQTIDFQGKAIEYSPIDSGVEIEHTVLIKGTYYRSVLLHDHYSGAFYLSDIPLLNETNSVSFVMEPDTPYYPYFCDEAGQPFQTRIHSLIYDISNNVIFVQFSSQIHDTQENTQWVFSPRESNFLVVGSSSRSSSFATYEKWTEVLYP